MKKPIFCIIYGADGIGKSTWASKEPPAIFGPGIDVTQGDAEPEEAAAQ